MKLQREAPAVQTCEPLHLFLGAGRRPRMATMAARPTSFIVAPDEARETLGALVRRHLGEVSWSRARLLCERGQVGVNGEPATDPARRLETGQTVSIDPRAPGRKPGRPGAVVAYEDRHLVVIDKPAGISSVPYERGERETALHLVRARCRLNGVAGRSLFVVHRIDKETSGLLVFAKTKTAERALARLFRAHAVERAYLAVAHGAVGARRIESRLVEDRGDGLRGSTPRPGLGKRAVTRLRVVERLPAATLCEARLLTGKTHQIRIHLAEAGHPLVGERVYVRDFVKRGRALLPSSRLLLHAATLAFTHPVTGARVELSSPLPPDFVRELERLRRTAPAKHFNP